MRPAQLRGCSDLTYVANFLMKVTGDLLLYVLLRKLFLNNK
nr:MAG TPA: hypothetical protein [Caudoviricetes sp.]